jgi:CDP-diacylglycerol--serine O-phosphatidyltransferase
LYVIIRYSQGVLFTLALVYMFSGIWARAAYGWTRRRRRRPAAVAAAEADAAEPDSLPLS